MLNHKKRISLGDLTECGLSKPKATYINEVLSNQNLDCYTKKDLKEIIEAKKYFELIINEFPNTEYANDSKFKLELIIEIMASKEMYLARYYTQREKWIPAINRYKKVVNEYDKTIYIE